MPQKRIDKLQIMLTDDELEAIEDFRFKFRLPSRSDAVRELIRRGLVSEKEFPLPEAGTAGSFGILDEGE
jgi:hypothetical protein